VVFTSALLAVGPHVLAASDQPLAAAVRAGSLDGLVPAVRIGASVASLGVLLSLLAGVSRTGFAMAARRDLPSWLAAVHPRQKVPYRAELVVGTVVVAIVLLADVRGAIGFSSFAVLAYYAIANASAYTLGRADRRWPRAWCLVGIAGCAVLACSLPWDSVLSGAALVASGLVVWAVVHALRRH
jgi:APA family basic amino acid/polyamine antiporter